MVSFLVLVGPSISYHRHNVSLPIKNLHVPLALNKSMHFKKTRVDTQVAHRTCNQTHGRNSHWNENDQLQGVSNIFAIYVLHCLTIYYHPFFPQQPIFVCVCGVSLASSQPNCIEGAFLELRLVGPRVVLWAMAGVGRTLKNPMQFIAVCSRPKKYHVANPMP